MTDCFFEFDVTVRIPQYVIEDVNRKNWKAKVFAAFAILIVGMVIGYFSSNIYVKQSITNLQQQNEFLDKKNQEQHSEIQTLKTDYSLLQTEIKVKNAAVNQIQAEFKDQIQKQNNYKSEINFYKQLLNPAPENKGLRVFQARLESDGNSFKVSLALAQKIERANIVSGKYSIEIKGTKQGEEVSFEPEIEDTNYKFKYFQNVSFRFSLPEGFQAESLNVKLNPSTKRSKTVQQSYTWRELLNKAG